MSKRFGNKLVIEKCTTLPQTQIPYYVIDIKAAKPRLNFKEIDGISLIGVFMGLLEIVLGKQIVENKMNGYKRTPIEPDISLTPTSDDINTAYPLVIIYLISYLSKGNSSALSKYSGQVALGLRRYLESIAITVNDAMYELLKLNVESLRFLRQFIDPSPQAKDLIGRAYISILIAESNNHVYISYAQEHYKHVCFYNVQWIKMIALCFDRKALHPASQDPDLMATVEYVRKWIDGVKEDYGPRWAMIGFWDPSRTKEITNRINWTKDFTKLAMASSDYDSTYDQFKIGNSSVYQYKNASHHQNEEGKWYNKFGRKEVVSVLPSKSSGRRGFQDIADQLSNAAKTSKMQKLLDEFDGRRKTEKETEVEKDDDAGSFVGQG